jgi:hypothetical protein
MTIQEIEIKRAYWDRKFENALKKFFKGQGEKIKKIPANNYRQYQAAVLKVIEDDKTKLRKLIDGLYIGIVEAFGTATFNELAKQKIFSIFAFGVYSWIATIALQQTSAISGYSGILIRNVVQKAIENGDPINAVANTIQSLFLGEVTKKRSKRIARTEVNKASNYGSWAGAVQTGLTLNKIWIATLDKRTRPTHKKASRLPPIDLDGYFKVGKGLLKYPGDPNGPLEEIVNCRCAIGYRRI